MRRKYAAVIVAVCLIAILFTVAFAATGPFYGRTRNFISTGNINIDIEEFGANNEVFTNVEDALPGKTYEKIVTVKNSGNQSAWVRVKVVLSEDYATISGLNTANWELRSDGCYYYKTVLEANKSTEALFTGISFPSSLGNDEQGKVVTVDVVAQAVQVANNPDADGWPEWPQKP